MNILFVATELAPFARVGDLADVVASLAKTLHQQGHQVTVVCPAFPQFAASGVHAAKRLTPVAFELNGETYDATLFDTRIATGVSLTLIEVGDAFKREGIYGEDGVDYEDNALRFALFSRAVTAWIAHLSEENKGFDIVHLHDWPTSLVALYAKQMPYAKVLDQSRFVLSIHNMAYQGIVPADQRHRFGIPDDLFHPEALEFYGKVNLLKGGIVFADALTTVSETYAQEILSEEYGFGLEGVLKAHSGKLVGIQNGVDYARCNPATDAALVTRYDAQDPVKRLQCKTQLLQELGLPMDPARPLVGVLGPLSDQKGADLLLAALPELLKQDVAVAVVGDGSKDRVAAFRQQASQFDTKLAFFQDASRGLDRRMVAGCDMLLIPSRSEPCGCVARCAQRYGALPIVHGVGGLSDAVVDVDPKLTTGSGFVFLDGTKDAIVGAMLRALVAYATPAWRKLQKRVMGLDVGWDRAGRRYERLYRKLVSKA